MVRDLCNDQMLVQSGWIPIHFWEKEVIKNLSECIDEIEETIISQLIDNVDYSDSIIW